MFLYKIKKYYFCKMKLIPTYEEAVAITNLENSPFYENVVYIDEYKISIFNYRLAENLDFAEKKNRELRGLTFVFNTDGTLFKRYILLEKFFNINQTEWTMYSVIKNYKIKYVNNKEDGSIVSFVKLPNGKVLGKSKMSFDNDQSKAINKIYECNSDIKKFIDFSLEEDITPIFEYVGPDNRIVLRYSKEELILLKLRDNKTGKHLDIKDYLDKIGSIKIVKFEDYSDLDYLMKTIVDLEDKEGFVVQAEDENGDDFFFKLKTPWYIALHGLITDDINKENKIIEFIINDKIDDILGQIPENETYLFEKINKIVKITKDSINEKVCEIDKLYNTYLDLGYNDKDFSLEYFKDANFGFVMNIVKCDKLKKLSKEEVLDIYDDYSLYEKSIERGNSYELTKEHIIRQTKKLEMAREWLEKRGYSL